MDTTDYIIKALASIYTNNRAAYEAELFSTAKASGVDAYKIEQLVFKALAK